MDSSAGRSEGEVMTPPFDPYRIWLGIPSDQRPPTYYQLVGAAPLESDPNVISECADKQMAHLRLKQGKNAPLAQVLLNEISAARVCLLDASRKQEYDEQLRQKPASRGKVSELTIASRPPAPGMEVAERREPSGSATSGVPTQEQPLAGPPPAVSRTVGEQPLGGPTRKLADEAGAIEPTTSAPPGSSRRRLFQTAETPAAMTVPMQYPAGGVDLATIDLATLGAQSGWVDLVQAPAATWHPPPQAADRPALPYLMSVALAAGAILVTLVLAVIFAVYWVINRGMPPEVATRPARPSSNVSASSAHEVPGQSTVSPKQDAVVTGVSDDRIVGTWESVDTPVPIVQEFSRDGKSKIIISGATTTGTYQLQGNIIDWRSGAMTARVTVKFKSPVTIELSSAGHTVRYRKTGSPQPVPPATKFATPKGVLPVDGKGDGPTDLLKLIDPQRDAVAGDWKCDGKTLITGANPNDRLEIPFEVPAEYRLTVVAYCQSHREALNLGLVAGSSQVQAIFDGWSKTATCLHQIDGTDGVQFPSTYRGAILRDGTPNVITCEVRANRISVDCNSTRVIDWTGDFKRLSINSDWKVRSARHLFIGSWDTHFEITKLELSPL